MRTALLALLALAPLFRLRAEELLSHRGVLEGKAETLRIQRPGGDVDRSVWTQRYGLDLGGTLGIPLVRSSEFGAGYSSTENLSAVVAGLTETAQEQWDFHARTRLGLLGLPQVSLSPFVSQSRLRSPLPGDADLTTADSSYGGGLNLSFGALPAYSVLWRKGLREIQGVRAQLQETQEFRENAAYSVGRFKANYTRQTLDSRDLRDSRADRSMGSRDATADLEDSDLALPGLRAYSLHLGYRDSSSGPSWALESQRQALANGYVETRERSLGPSAHSLRLGQTWEDRLEGSQGGLRTLAALSSRWRPEPHAFSNRLEYSADSRFNGSESLSEAYDMDLVFAGGLLDSRWLAQETLVQSPGRSQWTDLASQRLSLRRGRDLEGSLLQDYTAVRDSQGTRSQAVGLGATAAWRGGAWLAFSASYRSSFYLDLGGQAPSRNDNLTAELRLAPSPQLEGRFTAWYSYNDPAAVSSSSLFSQLAYRPWPGLSLEAGAYLASNSQSPRTDGAGGNRLSYLNYDAAARYSLGKTDFELRYDHDEKDYAAAFHRVSSRVQRSF